MTTPLSLYQQHLQQHEFVEDAAQQMAVEKLNRLHKNLLVRGEEAPKKSLLQRMRLAKIPVLEPVIGLYFWGGVGRGKTFLMDLFYESLPFERKLRMHFHRFMRRVHQELKTLDGKKNPLEMVADRIAQEARVLCFDEFFVSDITDAMILGRLMEHLFERGVTLVTTSNIVPDKLYENGLQRSRFLPAIALIKEYTEIMNVDGGVDYRLRVLIQAELYHFPLNEASDRSLRMSFDQLVTEEPAQGAQIEIEGRLIPSHLVADDVVWFDFRALCDGPRSQNDYIELGRLYHTVLISGIPELMPGMDDMARRFINLVDEFYDRNVKLVISAAVDMKDLYRGEGLRFEFRRTLSRLLEMQSKEYLARPHRA